MESIPKNEILKMLSLKKNRWMELKDREQDVVHENFINNVLLVLDWIVSDVEKM